ncbi:MAG: ComEC family competence protein, partial [Chloroflexota bacterium]
MRLVYLALGWALGIFLAEQGASQSPVIWGVLTLGALTSVSLLWRGPNRWWGIALVAMTLGGLRTSFLPNTSPIAAFNGSGGLTVTGEVVRPPDTRDTTTQLVISADTIEQRGQVFVIRGDVLIQAASTTDADYGDTIRATGFLEIPGTFDNFSYTDYLAQQGVYSIMRNAAVDVTDTGGGLAPYRTLLGLKARAADHINRSVPEPEAGLLVGILLGDDTGLSPELEADFEASGAAHIIAISGFNMAILAGIATQFLRGMRGAIIAITLIAVYTIFVGAGAAVVRAAVMSAVLIVGQAL